MDRTSRYVLTKHNQLTLLATFPGEVWEEEVAYVRRENQLAFVLVRETWGREAIEDSVAQQGPRLGALAEQWGCPVAGMISIRFWPAEQSARELLERVHGHNILVVCTTASGRIRFSPPQGCLSWHEPSRSVQTPLLPPFPQRWWLWRENLAPLIQELGTEDASRRRQAAMHLASATQRRLKDIPALVLLQSEEVTAETTRFFTHVLPHLGNIAGRRYVLWTLLYLGASLCFDPRFPERS
jgi:hypothetical protein